MIFVLNVLTIKEVQGLMHLKRISIMKNEDNCLSNRIMYHTAFLYYLLYVRLNFLYRLFKQYPHCNKIKWNIFYLILWTYQEQKVLSWDWSVVGSNFSSTSLQNYEWYLFHSTLTRHDDTQKRVKSFWMNLSKYCAWNKVKRENKVFLRNLFFS